MRDFVLLDVQDLVQLIVLVDVHVPVLIIVVAIVQVDVIQLVHAPVQIIVVGIVQVDVKETVLGNVGSIAQHRAATTVQ